MKYSKQKEMIRDFVLAQKNHPTADDVYVALKTEQPSLSLGTVYRNLNKLSEKGVINKIFLPNASDRFDGVLDGHYHLSCSVCGAFEDVYLEATTALREEIMKKTGFMPESNQLIVRGVCKNCRAPQ